MSKKRVVIARDYYIKTFLYGFEVGGKKFVLPEVKMEASYDYDAYEAIKRFKRNLISEDLIGCLGGDFKAKEFQDEFWSAVEENLAGYVSEALKRYREKQTEARKMLVHDLGNLLKVEGVESIVDEEVEK